VEAQSQQVRRRRPSGKLLGFIISHHDIEANPEKISAITNMKAPTCIKDVQKLTGCMWS
jgi:type III secretory pathway component EscU